MSNKIALATIQFRADAKGVNPALDSLRSSAKKAHEEVDQLQEALNKGVKTMKDANGVDFDVEKRLRAVTKEANNFDRAISELVKGATALEGVVKNIRLGEIEKSSRAELKGAINAAKARERSIREMTPEGKLNEEDLKAQRELNQVITESEKQLNRLDHDTTHIIETIQKGETVARSVLDNEVKGLRELIAMIPKGTDEWNKYNDQLSAIETHIADVRRQERESASALLGSKDLGRYSEEEIRTTIANAKELMTTYKTASPEAQALADSIVRAEQHLKSYGVEAARAAARENEQLKAEQDLRTTMNKRLRDMKSLSADALSETRRYWEAQRNGAAQGTAEFTKAEDALKKLDGYIRNARKGELQNILGDPSKFGVTEVRNAVQEAERMRDSLQKGIPVWHQYNNMVEQGKAYLEELARTEAADRMSSQMQRLNSLSSEGLLEVKKYWETMVAGAQYGSHELKQYEAQLAQVIEEEKKRNTAAAQQKVGILGSSNLGAYSEREIREAIEAGKQLIQTYKTASPEAARLGREIVEAETHLKKYGVEAERTAQRERDIVEKAERQRSEMENTMLGQLTDFDNLTESILKEQEKYWQRLIDDPKTAASSLEHYKNILDLVHSRQQAMMREKGYSALDFFRGDTSNASADEIKKQAAALKVYRDSLPQQTEADTIKEIDVYLAKTGRSAKDASKEMMSLSEALSLSKSAGRTAFGMSEYDTIDLKDFREQKAKIEDVMRKVPEGSGMWEYWKDQLKSLNVEMRNLPFSGTAEDLKKAQQTLEQAIATTDKGTPKYERLRMALSRVKAEMAGAGISAEKAQEILKNPKAVKNIELIKNSVAKARAELEVMGQRQERMQRLMKQAEESGRTETAKRLNKAINENAKAYEELSKSVKKADFAQKELAGTTKGAANAFEKAMSRLKTYITLYVGAAVAIQKITSSIGDLLELSDKMGEVRKTTGFTADEVGRLSENLRKFDTRTTLTGLMDLSVAAGQLGLKTQEDVLGFTEAANKLMVALPEMGREGATQMLKVALATGEIDKIRKQMEKGLIDGSSATAVAMEKVGSTIDRLRATSAATAPAITDFVKRVGAVGAQSGISIDQIAALGSTVDALGMRVEMSATALSRMIPAIRNNAFDIAKAIGITPDSLRNLFDTGRGMEAILMIFQHIKDSGKDADDIEKMMGMGNMKEIMKELNQQGARAGIVFAGLSQNVDELRRQLGVASLAYEENIAIEQEYIKMNETAAARWERLKNQFEEALVNDSAQRVLGWLIDRLRNIVDLLTGSGGVSVGLRTVLAYLILVKAQLASIAMGALKNIGGGLKNIAIMLGFVRGEMTKLQWGNVFTALAGAVVYLGAQLWELITAVGSAKRALAEVEVQTEAAITRFEGYYARLKDTTTALAVAEKKHKDLSLEVDRLRKSTDDSAKSTENLKNKSDELRNAEAGVTKASNDRRTAIASLNSIYGQYLGFMLTEYDRAELVAAAHDKITAAIRREMLTKQQQAALDKVSDKYTEDLAKDLGGLSEQLTKDGRLTIEQAAMAKRELQKFLRNEVKYNGDKGIYTTGNAGGQLKKSGYDFSKADISDVIALWFNNYLDNNFHLDASARRAITGVMVDKDIKGGWQRVYHPFHKNLRSDYADTYSKMLKEQTEITDLFTGGLQDTIKADEKSTVEIIKELKKKAQDAKDKIQKAKDEKVVNRAYEDLASALEGLDRNIGSIDPMRNAKLIAETTDMAQALAKDVNGNKLTAARTRINSLFSRATGANIVHNSDFGGTGKPEKSPWGSTPEASSTDYGTWDVNELVARRNQMDKFKNILKEDTDIERVLAEDKALMKAITNKEVEKDWKSVMKWYNQERLKIQEELKSERFSTNQGHWRDEKKGRGGRRNRFKESDYALAELDRYYSKRKEHLEKARIKENMSEELFNRQAEILEQEHLKKRSDLRRTFTADNSKEEQAMVKKFREWWKILEKNGDLDNVPWTTVESEWSKALASEIGRNNLRAQQDLTNMEDITVKHMNEIAKIVSKERPYDGITENLQNNLINLDILFADMDKANAEALRKGEGIVFNEADYMKARTERLKFLLGEAETAYSSTVDDMLRRMAESGMEAWADEIRKNPETKNALKAQTEKAFDEIQAAIKKESSQINKQMEIWWNFVQPGQKQSKKGGFEKMLSDMGLKDEQIKRANSLINAGYASERVSDKLAIKQMQIRLQMQDTYYKRMREMWTERIASLRAQGKELDAQHAEMSRDLSLSEEQNKLAEQRVAIANQLEESENRLYQELKEWGDLFASSLKDVFEASNTGNREYYNELAKMRLTGRGGPGAGTYIVTEHEGTEDATAHYEYLGEREALERQHEIEQQNALADAWKAVADEINQKMSESITDWLNASLQNQSIDLNTEATNINTTAENANTEALNQLAGQLSQGMGGSGSEGDADVSLMTPDLTGGTSTGESFGSDKLANYPSGELSPEAQRRIEESSIVTDAIKKDAEEQKKTYDKDNKEITTSTQGAFAKMTQAANLYGIAYQAMSNDNLDTSQKFQMIAVQAIGNGAITALTTNLAQTQGEAATKLPGIFGSAVSQLGPIAGPIAFAAMSALLGGLMGMAVSQIAKSKSQIAQATGASMNAGRLSTGMMTYAEGNVNEFTDPSTLTPGRKYDVDGADGRTYKARYMGKNVRTHITNGPEFHLVGEKGREAILDATTTRKVQMDDSGIWQKIQTLYNGGSLSHSTSRRGVRTFATGNVGDFGGGAAAVEMGADMERLSSIQASIDRQSDLLEDLRTNGIKAYFDVYGKGGLVDSYDKGKKNVAKHRESY